ncbi:MAG: hypothetical protein VX228_03220 [Pseudomonadota bacterium]|nr:hypothetical protein [Pseudomonadota bacterium]
MSDLPTYMYKRTFEGTLGQIWQAFSDPKLLSVWYGPGVETVIHEFDLRPGGRWLNSLTGTVKPAATEYLTTATTAWQSGLHSSSSIMVFYKNGAVKELQNTARDGVFDIYDVLSGSWQIEDGRGIVMNLRSKWKYYSSGYDYFQCTGGSVALDRAYGPRDGNAKSSWQVCSIQFKCERWSDNYPEKKSTNHYGSLVEWAPGDVAPKQLIWSQKQLAGRN